MTNPTVRIPKTLIPLVDKTAKDRGIRPSVLVGQAIRFYLSATDPSLVATAVAEAIKPLSADLRHVKYVIDKQSAATPECQESTEANRRDLLLEIAEQKRRDALSRINQKSHPSTTAVGTSP